MGLSTAMYAALSGLRVTQSGIDIVAENVSNAGSAGYTRKTLPVNASVVAGTTVGVDTGDITRSLDQFLQKQMRSEAAGGAYTATKVEYHDRLDKMFGTPGSANALDTIVNNFTNSLQALATSPDSYTNQQKVISNATLLTQQLNSLSSDVQLMRNETESALASSVDQANNDLANITRINDSIVKLSQNGVAPAALLDERDRYIDHLSSLMDIRVTDREYGKISISTTGGALLFDGEAAKLSFDQRGSLSAESLYDTDPSKRNVGTITMTSPNGYQVDMIGEKLIRSGQMGALADLRDNVLVTAQNQLDAIAAKLAVAVSGTQNGTPASSSGADGFDIDLTGIQNGNEIRVSYVNGGQKREAVFVPVDSSTTLPLPASYSRGSNAEVIGFTGGVNGAASAISTKLGSGFTVSTAGNILTILDDGSANTTSVTSAKATITNSQTSGGGVALPLFLDIGRGSAYTGSLDDIPQQQGFAGRIGINQDVVADTSLLVKWNSTTANADPTRPQYLLDALTRSTSSFAPDTGIGGASNSFTGTVASFAREVIATQGRDAQMARSIDSGQQVVVNTLADKFKSTSGVNIDTELGNLIQLQNAYSANARIMSIVKDMFDTLIKM